MLGRRATRKIEAVRIVIPAHNEAALIGGCLDALAVAMEHPALGGLDVAPLVVLDDCHDTTASLCRGDTLAVSFRNVGATRAAGFDHARRGFAPEQLWLATTDADTRVSPAWLAAQIELAQAGADAVFGVVDVDDWEGHEPGVRARFELLYAGTRPGDSPGHPHVHGASMGIRASTYLAAGGFSALSVGEDQDLSDRLDAMERTRVVRTTEVRATTSARRRPRAVGGFGTLLCALAQLSDGEVSVSH